MTMTMAGHLCATLRINGVDAHVSRKGPEKSDQGFEPMELDHFSYERDEWVWLERGPIRWARLYLHGGSHRGGGWYRVEFYVPDSRIQSGFGLHSSFHSTRQKSFPLFGWVVGVKWKARGWTSDPDFGSGVTNRLDREPVERSRGTNQGDGG